MDGKMENYVNCPVCNELVRVVMAPYTGFMDEITSMIEQATGIDKSDHFEGYGKCRCGRRIQATIHVTAIQGEQVVATDKNIVGMKALSIIMPWPWLIMKFGKDVENRSWFTSYQGRLLIHASKKPVLEALDMMNSIFLSLGQTAQVNENYREIVDGKWREICGEWCGRIVGTVDLVDCVRGYKSRWAEPGMWHWVLKNPVLFTDPIPARGSLRLWEYKG